MVTIINPETHYVGSTPPTPVSEFGQVVLYGYTVTHASISNVSGGTAEITEEEMFNMYFGPDYIGNVTFPISVTIGMDGPDAWEWQVDATDADNNPVWIDAMMLGDCMSIIPSGSFPTQVSFSVDSIGGVSIDKTTTTTRVLSGQAEFDTLSPSSETILYDGVPVIAVKEVAVGYGITYIGANFLLGAKNLDTADLAEATSVTSIGNSFLSGCENFNASIVIPSNVQTIGGTFLGGCSSFNSAVTIPNGVQSISYGFLTGCSSFNQPLTIPSSVASIGNNFLSDCTSFDQPLTIPSSVTTIGTGFLNNCTAYNKELILSINLRVIEKNFLYNCTSFNQNITLPNGLETINNGFLNRCYAFNKNLTLPTSLTSIGSSFISYMRAMVGYIDVSSLPATIISTDNNTLSSDGNNSPAYTTGVKIKGANRAAWLSRFPNRTSSPYRKLVDYGS